MTVTVQMMIADVEDRLLARGWAPTRRNVAAKMAALCGIHPITWRRWRSGDNEPNMGTWRKITAELAKIDGGKHVDRRANRRAAKAPRTGT